MKKTALYLFGMLSVLGAAPAHAQTLTYDNEGQLEGAAAVGPDSTRQLLVKLVALCSPFDTPGTPGAEQALQKWVARHQAYLEQNALSRRAFDAMLASPATAPQMRAALTTMLAVTVPKMIDLQFETIKTSVEAAGAGPVERAMCGSYIQAVSEGKFDLKNNDPALSAYFDRRIAAQGKPPAPAAAQASAPAAQASAEGAAGTPEQLIVGKWRHVALSRTIDGRVTPIKVNGGKVSAEWSADGRWQSSGGGATSSGTYRWLDTLRIEQTILASSLPIQVGMVSVKQIHVDAKNLELITVHTRAALDKLMPPPQAGAQRPNEEVITSTFARE